MSDERRAFAQTPSPERHVPLPGSEAVRRELLNAAVAGDGLGLLTAEPGLGKSHHASLLCEDAAARLTPVLLATGSMSTRRSMLQHVLAALDVPFAGLTESECRLALLSAATDAASIGRPLLLVVDDAERCNDRILEEFRALHNFVKHGVPLVRTVLVAEAGIEDRLSAGQLDAVNQRIASVVTLEPLSERDAAQYIGGRMEFAGLAPDELLTAEAIVEICRAADGSPRSLNALTDRTLSLADGPATSETVHHALGEVSALPYRWKLPADEAVDLEGLFEGLSELHPAGAGELQLEPLDGAVLEIGRETVASGRDVAAAGGRVDLRRLENEFSRRGERELPQLAVVGADQIEDALASDAEPTGTAACGLPGPDDRYDEQDSERVSCDVATPMLAEWDDVLPPIASEIEADEFVVDSGPPPVTPQAKPNEVEHAGHAAERLLDAVLPLTVEDPSAQDVARLEEQLSVRDEPLPGMVSDDKTPAVTAVGPSWPVERPPIIEPPGHDGGSHDDVSHDDVSHEEAQTAADVEPPIEGLFTRLRRRRLGV